MPDKEKVIKGLYEAVRVINDHVPVRYVGYAEQACFDALALLREQKPVKPTKQHIEKPNVDQWYCGECGKWIGKTFAYCPWCGRAVKWE